MPLKIKKLHSDAKVPTRAHVDDAGIDFYALEEVVFGPGAQMRVHTGIALEIPFGHVGLIWDKSGISFNQGLTVVGGVIDAGYRGEVTVSMVNISGVAQTIAKGQKFTQMLIQKIETPEIVEVAELADSARGDGREGSTGMY